MALNNLQKLLCHKAQRKKETNKQTIGKFSDRKQTITIIFLAFHAFEIKKKLNLIYNAVWGVFENKTNATSHPNIASLQTATEKKWNKMSEEFILEAFKLFRRFIDTIIEKKWLPY